MAEKVFGNEYRNTTVFIDSYEDCVLRGRFYNPYLDGPVHFSSTIEMVKEIERMLDEMKFPQAFNSLRHFGGGSVITPEDEDEEERGDIATFRIRIMFRQNSSWQGTVTWLDGKMEESFRSVLELLILMDSALASSAH